MELAWRWTEEPRLRDFERSAICVRPVANAPWRTSVVAPPLRLGHIWERESKKGDEPVDGDGARESGESDIVETRPELQEV